MATTKPKPQGRAVAAQPPKKNTALTQTNEKLPAYMRDDIGKGMENVGAGDYEMPRIKLMQGLSEEVQTYDGVKVGEFFHNMAERSLGSKVVVVPLYISTRYMLWNPRDAGGGILARADDGVHWIPGDSEFEVNIARKGQKAHNVKWNTAKTVAESGLAEWGTFDPEDSNSQPAATLCYVVVVALPDHPDISPVALFLQRTAVRQARKFLGKLKVSRAPIYGMRFMMSSFVDQNSISQDFQNYNFTADGFVSEEEYEVYKQMHEAFEKSGVKVRDLEGANDDAMDAERRGGDPDAASEKRY